MKENKGNQYWIQEKRERKEEKEVQNTLTLKYGGKSVVSRI